MRLHCLNPHYYEAEKLFMGHEDSENLREVESLMKGGEFAPGFNTELGDSWWKIFWSFFEYDASVDAVMEKIKARGNEWDKNSPVFGNAAYLNDIYTTMKKEYLAEARNTSQILIYDWTEPGEVEAVVEDIEALNFDHYGRYEEQQKDWRFVLEEVAAMKRGKYTNTLSLHQMRLHCLNPHYYEAEKLFMGHEDS